jgi:hypothetical protein
VRLSASALIYTWKWGDTVLAEQSGIGRSTFVATAPPQYRDAQITCTVRSQDGSLIAEASTVIAPVDAAVRIYRTDPLMGPDFDHALSAGYVMTTAEEAFRGVGYYFAALPSFDWAVSGQSASNDREVTVRATGSGEGNATLSLAAANSSTNQSASLTLPVHFGAKKTSNIFGF